MPFGGGILPNPYMHVYSVCLFIGLLWLGCPALKFPNTRIHKGPMFEKDNTLCSYLVYAFLRAIGVELRASYKPGKWLPLGCILRPAASVLMKQLS